MMRCLVPLCLIGLCGSPLLAADVESGVEEIRVTGQREPSHRVDLEAARTQLDLEAIESRQAASLFELLDDVPGVSLSGGPRANGTNIAVRGMNSNEDVLVLIDGAVKNFEKYRFGGLFIEPELLRTVAVSRGPVSVTQGSGALGGVIEMRTRNAADLLGPDERYGVMTRLGYASNNDEILWTAVAYARPLQPLDLLYARSRRQASDLELSDGSRLPYSAAEPESHLAKMEWHADTWMLGFSDARVEQQGREFFDATTFDVGVGGEVYRETDDHSRTLYGFWWPDSPWLGLELSIGQTRTNLVEERLDPVTGEPNGVITHYDYSIDSQRLSNTSQWPSPWGDWRLQLGVQRFREARDTAIEGAPTPPPPSGVFENQGLFAELSWEWQGLTLSYGRRWDRNEVRARDPVTRALLEQFGQRDRLRFDDKLESLFASYALPWLPLTVYASRTDAIRPPKLDQAFSRGASPSNVCLPIVFPPRYPALPSPQGNSGICAELYQPERARTREVGVQMEVFGLLWPDDSMRLRANGFANDVSRVLESLRTDPAHPTLQPGEERYRGYELELSYGARQWQMEFSYSETDAREQVFWVEGTTLHGGERPLRSVPGPLYALSLRWFSAADWDLGWRVTHRRAWTGLVFEGSQEVPQRQGNSTEHQLSASWRPFRLTTLRLTVDNVTNSEYRLPGGFQGSLGNLNTGRNIKLGWTQQFNF